MGNTCRHLYQRVDEHKTTVTAVGTHYKNCHNRLNGFEENFTVVKRCISKFDCLVNEMLYIKDLKPSLNIQSDSLKAKMFN